MISLSHFRVQSHDQYFSEAKVGGRNYNPRNGNDDAKVIV